METLDILSGLLDLNKSVSFKEFVTGKDFCNNSNLYDFWFNQLGGLSEDCNELNITGSLGGGKSYAAAYLMAYRVYCLFNEGDPRKKFGLDPDTWLYGLYFSVSMKMAEKQGYQYLKQAFKSCNWFKRYHPINEELSSCIQIPDLKFQVDYASAEGHQIGLNVWCFILDEANFRSGVGLGMESEYEEVTSLAAQLIQRQTSRFATPEGTKALAILISSAAYQSSFMEKRIESNRDNDKAKVITVRTYDVKPEQYSKETFEVFTGAGQLEPQIVKSPEHRKALLKSLKLPEDHRELFLQVPVSLKSEFENKSSIMLALQNICGVPTVIQGKFVSNLYLLEESYRDYPRILISDELEASTADDSQLIENVLLDNIEYPERPHSLFLDLSYGSDMGGLCCYRYDGLNVNNQPQHTRVFLLGIRPPLPPHQTKISKVEQFIYDLSEYINIQAFGSDQFQSVQIRQNIQANLNLEDIRISIDSSDIPHLHWLQALADRRLVTYKHPRLEREVEEAQHDYKRHRIVKRKGSSDDIFQCEVGAFFLSDTIGRSDVDVSQLYGDRLNLVGARAQQNILNKLGYLTVK